MAKATTNTDASPGERLDRAIHGTKETIGKTMDVAREQVSSLLEEARHGLDTVQDGLGSLKDKTAGDMVEDIRHLVRQHPGTSVLVSLGAGILLGWMLRGRD